MTVKMSAALANSLLDQIETFIGTNPILRFFTGAAPANVAAANSGTLIGEITLDGTWADDAASAIKALSDLPLTDPVANAAGIIGHFRFFASGGTCHLQGSVSEAGGGGDMIIDNADINAGQEIRVTAMNFNFTAMVS